MLDHPCEGKVFDEKEIWAHIPRGHERYSESDVRTEKILILSFWLKHDKLSLEKIKASWGREALGK